MCKQFTTEQEAYEYFKCYNLDETTFEDWLIDNCVSIAEEL